MNKKAVNSLNFVNESFMISVKQVPPAASSSYSSAGSCFESVDAELKRMIQQVKDVMPQVPVMAVKKDLGRYLRIQYLSVISLCLLYHCYNIQTFLKN